MASPNDQPTCSCRAALFTNIETVECGEIPFPQIETPADAILKVIVAGICGSDLHPFHGKEPCAYGTAFGHECVGEIISLGRDVTNFMIGDLVSVPFSVAYAKNLNCLVSLLAFIFDDVTGWKDEKGNGIHGAQSEYVRIPQAQGSLYKLSPDLNPEEGLLLGDILSTAIYAAAQAGVAGWHSSGASVRSAISLMTSIQPTYEVNDGKFSEVYAVVGMGPVGLLVVAAIRTFLLWRGVAPKDIFIFAIDTVSERLTAASRWGATPLQLTPADPSSEEMILAQIREVSRVRGRSGQGVDAVVECVGSSSAVSLAYKLLAPGGTLSSVGVHSTSFPITPADIYDKNVTYRSGRCPARSLMPVSEHMLRWLRCPEMRIGTQGEGQEDIHLTDIITHRMALEEISKAYHLFDKKLEGCLKPVIYPHGLPEKSDTSPSI